MNFWRVLLSYLLSFVGVSTASAELIGSDRDRVVLATFRAVNTMNDIVAADEILGTYILAIVYNFVLDPTKVTIELADDTVQVPPSFHLIVLQFDALMCCGAYTRWERQPESYNDYTTSSTPSSVIGGKVITAVSEFTAGLVMVASKGSVMQRVLVTCAHGFFAKARLQHSLLLHNYLALAPPKVSPDIGLMHLRKEELVMNNIVDGSFVNASSGISENINGCISSVFYGSGPETFAIELDRLIKNKPVYLNGANSKSIGKFVGITVNAPVIMYNFMISCKTGDSGGLIFVKSSDGKGTLTAIGILKGGNAANMAVGVPLLYLDKTFFALPKCGSTANVEL